MRPLAADQYEAIGKRLGELRGERRSEQLANFRACDCPANCGSCTCARPMAAPAPEVG